MSQTMMAFLAMMIAGLAALNQLTAQVGAYEQTYRSEYELMANAVVLEQMEVIDMTTDYDDLEDWDGDVLTRSFEVSQGNIDFLLTIQVQYVEEDGTPSATETDQKEVTIAATQEKFNITLVTHSRMIAE